MDYKTYLDYKKIYLLLYGQQHYTSWHINGTDDINSEFDASSEMLPFITADLSSFKPINIEYSTSTNLTTFVTTDLSQVEQIDILADINSPTLHASALEYLLANDIVSYVDIDTAATTSPSSNITVTDTDIEYSSYLDSAKIYVEAWFYVAHYDHGQVISDVSDMTIKRFTYDRI